MNLNRAKTKKSGKKWKIIIQDHNKIVLRSIESRKINFPEDIVLGIKPEDIYEGQK